MMGTCSRCGDAVDFRIFNDGRCVPMHLSGRCAAIGGGASRWGRSEASESACFLTHCPEGCGADVFFIRHNGGSVWVDSPLGYPWYKHICMYPEEFKVGRKSALEALASNVYASSTSDLILAVATAVEFSIDWSEWHVLSGERDEWHIHTNGNCCFLAGGLVIFDLEKRILISALRPELSFRILMASKTS